MTSLLGRGMHVLVGGLLSATLIVGAVQPASAETLANSLSVSAPSGVVTLPAADGIRDTTTVTVTSQVPTTVRADFYRDGLFISRFVESASVSDDPLTSVITVPLAGMPTPAAGAYEIRVTDNADETVTTSTTVIVGSGTAKSVTLSSTTPTQLYPYPDGQRDSVSTRILVADETGLAIAAAGTMKIVTATKSTSAPVSVGAVATPASLSTVGLPHGAATLQVAMRGTGGGSALAAAGVALNLKPTAITAVALSVGSTQVYPSKDGYQDTVGFKATVSATGVLVPVPVTGTIEVLYGATVVAKWTLSSLGARSVSWNGLNGGRVVQGTYTIKASARGPEGPTVVRSTSVYVSAKKLVTVTAKATHTASALLDQVIDYSISGYGECYEYQDGAVECNAYYDDVFGLVVLGSTSIPAAVLGSRKYATPEVRITANISYTYGLSVWGYGPPDGSFVTANWTEGASTAGWTSLGASASSVDISGGLTEYADVIVDSYVVEYRYSVLR